MKLWNFIHDSIYKPVRDVKKRKIYFEFSVWQTTNSKRIMCAIKRPNLYNFAKSSSAEPPKLSKLLHSRNFSKQIFKTQSSNVKISTGKMCENYENLSWIRTLFRSLKVGNGVLKKFRRYRVLCFSSHHFGDFTSD